MVKKMHGRVNWGVLKSRLGRVFVRRDYKDRLFVKLFHDKRELLTLYNALNGTEYTDPEALLITTIDDVVFMGMKNDCSFIIGSYINLYEQQSTFNPNMPIRGLLYLAHMYEAYIKTHQLNVYGTAQVKLPTPKYVVFYNGTGKRPEREVLRLTDAFEHGDSCLEFTATMYNINQGYNQALLCQCSTLEGYSIFVGKVREYCGRGQTLKGAIDAACVYCIDHDILKEFLQKNRSEVARVLLAEYDAKKQRQMDIRDAKEEGRREGHEEGRKEGIRIFILDNQEGKVCRERILEKLQTRFGLDREQAENYFEEYSQGEIE